MLHKIITASGEVYTIKCHNKKILSAAVFLLGEGKLSTESEETSFRVPQLSDFKVPFLGFIKLNANQGFKRLFKEDFVTIVNNHKEDIAKCLNTVFYGDKDDRDFYEGLLKRKSSEYERKEFIYNWNNRNDKIMDTLVSKSKVLSVSLLN